MMNASRALVCAVFAGALAIGCGGGSSSSDCKDGADNDADGLIDEQDPGCLLNGDREAPDPVFNACADSVDNDGDGLIDFPDDPGCVSPTDDDEFNSRIPECRDGIDNDGDGLVDFPNDPGCFLSLENNEEDDCPSGPNCPQCANSADDDGDGLIDYGNADTNDPGCDRAADDDEFNADPGICGNVQLLPLPSDGIATGMAEAGGGNELISSGCGGSGQETVFTMNVTDPTSLFLTTDFPETTLDTVIYVRSDCRDPDSELGCNDDASGFNSTLLVDATPGLYYIIVDAHDPGSAGDFKLQVSEFIPRGEPCDPVMPQCAPGLVCRLLDGAATVETCELPECSDTLDNDADGDIDFPNDPGCTDADDNEESTDDCSDCVGNGGAGCSACAACGNGSDDDLDGLTDYSGSDPGCSAASDDNEIDECIPGVDVNLLIPTGVTGTTSGVSNFVGSCGFGSNPEDVYSLKVLQDLLSITFSTEGSALDTVTYVRLDTCDQASAEIACEDPGTGGESVTISNPVNGGTYFVFVDGDFSSGSYMLSASGVIPGGGSCDPTDTQFICESGWFCDVNICNPADCNNTLDDDVPADGLADYLEDPGCSSISDPDESDDCSDCVDNGGSGCSNCPQCSNGADDDMDGQIDWGNDPGCAAAGDDIEDDCPGETDPIEELTSGTVAASTVGLTDDFAASCSTLASGPDKVYILPVGGKLNTLRVDTEGSALNTVIYMKQSECSSPELACNDEDTSVPFGASAIDLLDLDPGSYIIMVDGRNNTSDDYVLNVHGVLRALEPCDPTTIASGLFSCESGYACNGTFCDIAQCNNTTDDDVPTDGLADFPADPGCDTISDDDESDDCSDCVGNGGSGCTACPDCSNGSDDDMDGQIDFGLDPGCVAASDPSEVDECIPGVEVLVLTDAGATGTTPISTAGSNFSPTCHTSTSSTEDVYSYNLTADLSSITFSTMGSVGDTVTYVRFGDCADIGTEVGCDNIQSSGEDITINNPAQGFYYVFVDGDFVSQISYVLNVSGTIPTGNACNPVDTQFVCEAGSSCDGGTLLCEPSQCNNASDDDSDGLIDAFDPGCADVSDDDESDDTCVATPATCPQCANGMDDDSDGLTDYQADSGCTNAADDNEDNCDEETEPINVFDASPETGTTVGATSDFVPSCSTTSTAPDVVLSLTIPGDMVSLDVDTIGTAFDTVLMIKQNLCANTDYACDDDYDLGIGPSEINLTNVPAGVYFLIVDGFSTNSGAFTLNVGGVIQSGQPCDPAQVTAGFFTCEGATTCTDPGGGFTCN